MTTLERIRAFAVHVFTACGAALALLALILATGDTGRRCSSASVLRCSLTASTARWRAPSMSTSVLPRWNGETLDLVVDFVTYVFVPAFAIAASGLLPEALAIPAGIAVTITGALYFADREMKTHDNYFKGFPAVWNLAAFYLYVLRSALMVAASGVAALRLCFPADPFRASVAGEASASAQYRAARRLGGAGVGDARENLDPGPYVTVPLGAIAVYFLVAGLLREA